MPETDIGILALATATPDICMTQADVGAQFAAVFGETPRRQAAIRTIFDKAGVQQRHVARPVPWFLENRTTEDRNNAYVETAVPLGEHLLTAGLTDAGYTVEDVDEFYTVSCTGITTPGLDLLLAGKLGMRGNVRRTGIIGMGCYGSFPALRRAYDAVHARPDENALVYSVELCSLHMQHNATSENVVSTALFADGAGMALIGAGHGPGLPSLLGFRAHSDYTTIDQMAFHLTDHGFRMVLSSYVPNVLRSHAVDFVDGFLADHDLTRDDVRHWGIHPGSTKIVDYIAAELGLADADVAVSHEILAENGNMSSATILFVLERICEQRQPAPGEVGMLMAFGPGLTIEAALLRW
ncbi:MAG: 3-oxoacyl-[acyl-carrier-protein] synthase III C-terminal domain-containing protein [Chloroflexota bacterium]